MPVKFVDGDNLKQAIDYIKDGTISAGLAEEAKQAESIKTDRQIDDPELSCPPIVFGTAGGEAEIQTGNNEFQYLYGNSKKWNQLAQIKSSGSEAGISFTNNNGVLTVNGTGQDNGPYICVGNASAIKYISGHKIYSRIKGVITGCTIALQIYYNSQYKFPAINSIWSYNHDADLGPYIKVDTGVVVTDNEMTCEVFDLTAMGFDLSGTDEEIIARFNEMYPLDYYAYEPGTILDSTPATLKSVGRNQWDEQWRNGYYSNGTFVSNANYVANVNPIKVLPNIKYCYINESDVQVPYAAISYYDANEEFISQEVVQAGETFTTPSNCAFVNFYINDTYGSTYNNDICIYIEWDTPGLPYVAYREQVVQLPNIPLRSVGDVRDEAYASGGGKRKTIVKDLTQLNWVYDEGNNQFYSQVFSDLENGEAICSAYIYYPEGYLSMAAPHTRGVIEGRIYIIDESLGGNANLIQGTIICKLKEESQTDIPTSENPGWTELVYTDNYGTLEFITDPVQVPQVPQAYFIKYTISLTEWVDSAYTRTDGDANNIALLSDVDQLKEDLDNGTIVPEKSRVTKNLEPVSEESGSTQTAPFINQATATNNNDAQTSVDTGTLGQHLEKRGNVVVVNQKIKDPMFKVPSSPRWSGTGFSLQFSTGLMHADFLSNVQYGSRIEYSLVRNGVAVLNEDHKYMWVFTHKENRTGLCVNFTVAASPVGIYYETANSSTSWKTEFGISNGRDGNFLSIRIPADTGQEEDWIEVKFAVVIDLTQYFNGNDNIPADLLAHPENFFRYYQGDLEFTTGQLVASNGRYLVNGGQNVWDEEWENGSYNTSTGEATESSTLVRSKSNKPIRIIPNTQYHYKGGNFVILYYDKNDNFIKSEEATTGVDAVKTTPSNACFMRFRMAAGYGTTYNHDITISLYYEGEDYSEYVPYEAPAIYDTGNEELGAFDTKDPDGIIHKNTKTYTCVGDEGWDIIGEGTALRAIISSSALNITPKYSTAGQTKVISNKFVGGSAENVGEMDIGTYLRFNVSGIATTRAEFNTWLQNNQTIIQYETAEETEQGTPFAENMDINDMGNMAWYSAYTDENTNTPVSIPQGCKIFYPAWYAGFIDTLGQREDIQWAPDEIVSQEQLGVVDDKADDIFAIMKENVGGALRHQLADKATLDFNNTAWVDLGNITWYYDSAYPNVFSSVGIEGIDIKALSGAITILCSKYKSQTPSYRSNVNDACICQAPDTASITVKDVNFSDAATFKAAMKGILLAYEKASE